MVQRAYAHIVVAEHEGMRPDPSRCAGHLQCDSIYGGIDLAANGSGEYRLMLF